ncbi:MAG: peptidase U62 [Phycisphaerae bacterium]|nr:peptidase U62 [Phycisphaerae bacterium]
MTNLSRCLFAGLLLVSILTAAAVPAEATPPAQTSQNIKTLPLMKYLSDELEYSMKNLVGEDGTRPYYLAYAVYDEETGIVSGTLGAITRNQMDRSRNLNIDLRVGDYALDNTRQLREGGPSHWTGGGNVQLALDDAPESIRHALWYNTDEEFKRAVKRLVNIQTNLKVKVEEEDQSNDFSREEPQVHFEEPVSLNFDRDEWAKRVRTVSAIARDFPLIYDSSITVGTYAGNRYFVSSEGSRLQTNQLRYRITLTASTKAEDGMDLDQTFTFNSSTPEGLPGDAEIESAFRDVIRQVLALREAPLAEPYIGPAILRNRASAVFFHEIFGHRIEGHRQKDVTEGQTFTRKVDEQILPTFISVFDDPTVERLAGEDLRGYYLFDDEGVKAQRAVLVDHGVLKGFLMSRTPLEGFPHSNGHGRRQTGYAPVSRQANLIVESSKEVPFDQLRAMLIEECKQQGRPYGLLFEDISGGFTTTNRWGPQSYKVLPIVVFRVYTDGRPDELIRGADVVGTPLTSFEKIVATGDDPAVFNGSCGAESGWVPVSAVSPSILVSTIEIEKRMRSQSRPPILPPPLEESPQTRTAAQTQ